MHLEIVSNANNILLKDFAYGLYTGYQKILEENQNHEKLPENNSGALRGLRKTK